jgi:hypothetical protein
MSNPTKIYIEILHLVSDSHRTLLSMVESTPSEYTIAERKRVHEACERIQGMLDKITENK